MYSSISELPEKYRKKQISEEEMSAVNVRDPSLTDTSYSICEIFPLSTESVWAAEAFRSEGDQQESSVDHFAYPQLILFGTWSASPCYLVVGFL